MILFAHYNTGIARYILFLCVVENGQKVLKTFYFFNRNIYKGIKTEQHR